TGMLWQRIAQLRERISGVEAEISGIERQRAAFDEEIKGARELLASGYTPKTRVLALERSAAQLDGERGAKLADIATSPQPIGEAELAIAKADRARTTEITDQLRTTQSHLAELGPRIDAARDVLARTRITAPASGSVVGLAMFTEGGVVQPGARVLDIVPSDIPLIADGRLRLTDVNDVKPGYSADIRLVSLPRSERPRLRGEVMTVSADKLTDEKSGQGYFSIRARLNADDVKVSRLTLQPGMPVEVIVTTRPRSFVDYLLSPLLDEVPGASREK